MTGRSLDVARDMMAAKGFSGDELERQARHRVFSGIAHPPHWFTLN